MILEGGGENLRIYEVEISGCQEGSLGIYWYGLVVSFFLECVRVIQC